MQIIIESARLAKEKYGVDTLVLYLTGWENYSRKFSYSGKQVMRYLRAAGLHVIDAGIDQNNYPNNRLVMIKDPHPTGFANSIRAKMIRDYVDGRADQQITVAEKYFYKKQIWDELPKQIPSVAVWRLNDGFSHLYTTNCEIANEAQSSGRYDNEGRVFFIHTSADNGNIPLYWLFNGGDNLFTTKLDSDAVSKNYEFIGVIGYISPAWRSGLTPLYEAYDTIHKTHFYTIAKCRVPDDCIDPRRLALFSGRAFFRDLITTLKARQFGEFRP